MNRHVNKILVIVVLILISIFMVSCSEEVVDESTQEFTFMIPDEGSSLDPNLTNETYSTAVLYHLYEGLVIIDENGALKNAAAESIEVTEGNTYFTFNLRDDLKWSDGKQVTAQDFKTSWMRMLDPNTSSVNASVFSPYVLNVTEYMAGEVDIEEVGIYVIDELTLAVRTKAPTPYLVDILTHSAFAPSRTESIEMGDNWSISPDVITNGAFMIDEYVSGSHVTLKKNPYYHDAENISLDVLRFEFRNENMDVVEMYNSGAIDGLFEITAAELRNIPESELETNSFILTSTAFITYNHENDLMANKKFREVVSSAIDRKLIVDQVLSGAGIPSKYLVPFSYTIAEEQFRDYTELDDGVDLERAKILLQELKDDGLYDGRVITFHYMTGGPDAKITEEIVKRLETDLDMPIEAIGMAWADLYELALNDDYDILMMGWGADYPHPMTFLNIFGEGSFYAPITRWRDLEYEQMLKDYLLITDEKDGLDMLRAIEDKILDEDHITPVYHRKSLSIISQDLKGWHHGATYFNFNYAVFEE